MTARLVVRGVVRFAFLLLLALAFAALVGFLLTVVGSWVWFLALIACAAVLAYVIEARP